MQKNAFESSLETPPAAAPEGATKPNRFPAGPTRLRTGVRAGDGDAPEKWTPGKAT